MPNINWLEYREALNKNGFFISDYQFKEEFDRWIHFDKNGGKGTSSRYRIDGRSLFMIYGDWADSSTNKWKCFKPSFSTSKNHKVNESDAQIKEKNCKHYISLPRISKPEGYLIQKGFEGMSLPYDLDIRKDRNHLCLMYRSICDGEFATYQELHSENIPGWDTNKKMAHGAIGCKYFTMMGFPKETYSMVKETGSLDPIFETECYIAEGIATALSVYYATSKPCISVATCGNLPEVTRHFSKGIVIADNDIANTLKFNPSTDSYGNNVGVESAKLCPLPYIVLENKEDKTKSIDANDFHVLYGLEALKAAIEDRKNLYIDHIEDAKTWEEQDTMMEFDKKSFYLLPIAEHSQDFATCLKNYSKGNLIYCGASLGFAEFKNDSYFDLSKNEDVCINWMQELSSEMRREGLVYKEKFNDFIVSKWPSIHKDIIDIRQSYKKNKYPAPSLEDIAKLLSDRIEGFDRELFINLYSHFEKANKVVMMGHSLSSKGMKLQVEVESKTTNFLQVDRDSLDYNGNLLNTPDGVIDLRTGEMRKALPSDKLTNITAVAPRTTEEGQTLLFNTLFKIFWMPNVEDTQRIVDYIQLVMGYCLYGKTDLPKDTAFFLTGSGGNGKNTLFETLHFLIGGYSGILDAECIVKRQKDTQQFRLKTAIFQKRLTLTDELETGAILNDVMLKRLVDGSPLKIEEKMKQPFDYKPYASVLVNANALPRINMVDDAIRRRVKVIFFPNSFKVGSDNPMFETDPELKSKLLEVAGGDLLAFAIEGARKIYELKFKFDSVEPLLFKERKDEWLDDSDWFINWIDERVITNDEGFTKISDAYRNFCSWSISKNIKVNKSLFKQKLISNFGNIIKRDGYEGVKGLSLRSIYELDS